MEEQPSKIDKVDSSDDNEEQERTTVKKAEFLENLELAKGILNVTCAKTGIVRQTYYNWRENDKEFKVRVDHTRSLFTDEVEDIFWGLITAKNVSAVIFYLKNNHPKYKEKLALSGEVTTVNKYENLTYEQLIRQLAELQDLKRKQGKGDDSGGEGEADDSSSD